MSTAINVWDAHVFLHTHNRYINIEPTKAIDVQREEGDKGYKVPVMDDLLRIEAEDRVMVRCVWGALEHLNSDILCPQAPHMGTGLSTRPMYG